MAADVMERIEPVTGEVEPELLVVSSFSQTLERIGRLYAFPAVLVCAVGASYDTDASDPFLERDGGINVFVVGEYKADEAADRDLLDLVDRIALLFLPGNAADDVGDEIDTRDDAWPGVVLNGVRYVPRRIQPVDTKNGDRTAFALQLDTTDCMEDRGIL